jgi:hypothetical protein
MATVFAAASGASQAGGVTAVHTHSLIVDGRCVAATGDEEDQLWLAGAGAALRTVWSTEKGDRAVFYADFDWSEHEQGHFDQIYLQGNGPLGRWKVRAGRYFVPFGLLPSFNTEYLLLASHEEEFLGLRSDAGVQVLGYFDEFDYALSASLGAGTEWRVPEDKRGLFSGRLGWAGQSTNVGVSALYGYVLDQDADKTDRPRGIRLRRRLGVDATLYRGRAVLRAEVSGGSNSPGDDVSGTHDFGGAQAFWDFAFSPKWEWNTKYAYQDEAVDEHAAGLGITYTWGRHVRLRAAAERRWREHDTFDVGQAQLYAEF